MTLTLKTPLFFLLATATAFAGEPEPVVPEHKVQQTLVDSERLAAAGEQPYLAFPTLVRIDDRNVLISYKRGRSHALDPGAVLEIVRFNTRTKEVGAREVLGTDENLIYQMGEWIEFPSGRIGLFADVQRVAQDGGRNRHHRTGVEWCKSDDRGQTFSPMQRMGPVDGVEYGYIFEGIIANERVYMLAMSFPEMTERKSFFDEAGNRIFGEVSVLVSADNGETWGHVRNLSQEFGGIDINESSLTEYGEGFIVATRGYDGKVRLHLVDKQFRLVQQCDLTADYDVIRGVIGRPRLFWRDGKLYLLGRNHSTNRPGMELALFRICPESLGVERYVILDPEEDARVGDSYYAVVYFEGTGDDTMLNVITYRTQPPRRRPDVVRLEFLWDQVR